MDNPGFFPDFLIDRAEKAEFFQSVPDLGSKNGGKGLNRDEELLSGGEPPVIG